MILRCRLQEDGPRASVRNPAFIEAAHAAGVPIFESDFAYALVPQDGCIRSGSRILRDRFVGKMFNELLDPAPEVSAQPVENVRRGIVATVI